MKNFLILVSILVFHWASHAETSSDESVVNTDSVSESHTQKSTIKSKVRKKTKKQASKKVKPQKSKAKKKNANPKSGAQKAKAQKAKQKAIQKAFTDLCPVTIADMKEDAVFVLQAEGRSKGPDDAEGDWSLKDDQLVIRNKDKKFYQYTIVPKGESFLINKVEALKDSSSHWIVNAD